MDQNLSKINPKSTKNQWKNQPKIDYKSTKNRPKIDQERNMSRTSSWEPSWRRLEGVLEESKGPT